MILSLWVFFEEIGFFEIGELEEEAGDAVRIREKYGDTVSW